MGHSFIAFIIVIGVLVFIHEFGHFIVARLCGVGVDVFSLGFGPKLIKKKYGRTEYCLSAIPLGGYVKMVGEEPGATIREDDLEASFTHKPVWKRALIVAAGPFFNFFLAIFIFYILYQISGLHLAKPIVGEVVTDTPAFSAGILPGDTIVEIDGRPIVSFGDISDVISKNSGTALEIVVQRETEYKSLLLTPMLKPAKNVFGEDIQKFVIGIVGNGETFHQPLSFIEAGSMALRDTYGLVELTILSVGKMISGTVSADNLGGPLRIAQMAGEQAKAGMINFLWFIALLSVNLGIINLFPVPVLDGGHLLFFFIEAVTGKAVSNQIREKLAQFGAAALVALMVFVFYNDIVFFITK